MSFFKAYDMRGEFGKDFTIDTVYRVGRWLPSILGARRFLIGRDMRLTSDAMRDALCAGLNEAGADVDDMGLSTTPMVYFFTAKKDYDASVMITASHNPKTNNGMKVSKRGAIPVGGDTGLGLLESRIATGKFLEPAPVPGVTRLVSYLPEYISWLKNQGLSFEGLRFAVDCSDGAAGILAHSLFDMPNDLFGSESFFLNDKPDGDFPHHSPNPLAAEAREQISALVREKKLDCGLIFDGDADRVMFVDEKGTFVQPDYLIPVIARHFLKKEPKATVIHDIRTSRGAINALKRDGAKPVMGKVGHAFAKVLMRQVNAVCGGELAGHYYFRDFVNCDSGELAALIVLSAVAEAKAKGSTFSKLMKPILRFQTTGECNFRIEDKDAALNAARQTMEATYGKPQSVADFDGIRMEYKDGWISIRKSNTEPFLRLIVEAKTADIRDAWYRLIVETFAAYQ
ncbi:MAG: phosphomannomutase/phosphoglucomutase [Kiritimatiellae bacterium]|nr:phosphomannomutase/phosphoglucomutase [Kiritimatiellia bacterium]